MSSSILHIYTDGSYKENFNYWTSSVVVINGTTKEVLDIYLMKSNSFTEYKNVVAEYEAVKMALDYCKALESKAILYHDYKYVEPSKKSWEKYRNPATRFSRLSEVTANYLSYLESHNYKKYVEFKHIKSHIGNKGNELADIACSLAYRIPKFNIWTLVTPELKQLILRTFTELEHLGGIDNDLQQLE